MLSRSCLFVCAFALLAISTPAYATVITATPVSVSAVAGTPFTATVATFTDDNPAATPASFTAIINWGDSTPPGAGTITANGQLFTVTGSHTYANPGTFTLTVTISDVPPGTGTATVTETATVASPTLPPTITKAFADAELQLFGPSTAVSFTLINPNTTTLTGVGFTDTLPAGLVVSTPNGLTAKCGLFLPGGGITAVAGSNSISLSGATLAPGASCTFSVNVTGIAIGVQTNTTSVISASGGTVVGVPATATTSVDYLFFNWFLSE